MNKKFIIFANYFCAWDGGIDLLKHWLTCINYSKSKRNLEIIIVLPKNNIISFMKLIFIPLFLKKFLIEKKIVFRNWPYWYGAKEIENHIKKNLKNHLK